MRRTDRVAWGCFAGALAGFALFHMLPVFSHGHYGGSETQYGWMIWENWWDEVRHLDRIIFDPRQAMAWAAVHALAAMLLASPWLVRTLSVHRLTWWLMALMSAATVVGLTGLVGYEIVTDPPDPATERLGIGMYLLLAIPVLHFTGVLFVRRRVSVPPGR